MAIRKIREQVLNDDLTYRIIHRRTSSDVVTTDSDESLQEVFDNNSNHINSLIYNSEGVHGIRYNLEEESFQVFNPDTQEWWTVDGTIDAVLQAIAVTNPPSKTEYKAGEEFNTEGMIVTAQFAGFQTSDVANYTVEPSVLTSTTEYVTITYVHDDVTKTCQYPVTVDYITGISVTTAPDKTSYKPGESINTAGMIVEKTYKSGDSEIVTGYSFSPKTVSASTTQITVSYTEGGITKTCTTPITVIGLSYIEIESPPNKTVYTYGDTFSTAGLSVRAHYTDGSSSIVTGSCSTTPSNGASVTHSHTKLVVRFTDGGITKTDSSVSLTINKKLTGIVVASLPDVTDYAVGDKWSSDGLVVNARYSDGSTTDVTDDCSFSPSTSKSLTASDTTVTVTYSSYQTSFNLNIGDTLSSIDVTTNPAQTSYEPGESFNPYGMVVTFKYASGSTETITDTSLFTYSPDPLTLSTTKVTVSYSSGSKTFTDTVSVSVSIAGASSILEYNDWETIARVAERGAGQDLWDVGDTKSITVFGNSQVVCILDFNHDALSSSISGYNTANYGKANITFGTLAGIQYDGYSDQYPDYFRHHSSQTNIIAYSWKNSVLRTALNTESGGSFEIISGTSGLTKSIIKQVRKIYWAMERDDTGGEAEEYTDDYLWIFSAFEVAPSEVAAAHAGNYPDGSMYPGFSGDDYFVNDTDKSLYWLRSRAIMSGYIRFLRVNYDYLESQGLAFEPAYSNEYSDLLFGFCV